MGIVDEMVKNKEELLIKLLEILEGKETTTKINLDGIQFTAGKIRVKVDGSLQFTVTPLKKKK